MTAARGTRPSRGGVSLVRVGNARSVAADALARVLDDGAFAAPALSAALGRAQMDERERAFATELFYGSLRFAAPLEESLRRALDKPKRGLDARIRPHLLVAAYQLQHLASTVPPHAAVSEAVSLVKRERPGLEGFANAILRHLGSALFAQLKPDATLAEIAAAYGVPLDLALAIAGSLQPSDMRAAIAGLNARPTTYAWIVRPDAPTDLVRHAFVPRTVALGAGPVARMPGFVEGDFLVVDPGSALAALLLAPRPGARVIDLCAAPGTKTSILAGLVGEAGSVLAVEKHERRARRIGENAARLGLTNVATLVADALTLASVEHQADAVLVDAPCSGLGTTRRRPEIKLRRTADDIARAATLQGALLEHAAKLVAPGGAIVYSVCSPLPQEGIDVVKGFLARHEGFRAVHARDVVAFVPDTALDEEGFVHLRPHLHDTDAFFLARLVRST